jgi:hypothetical protein
VRAVDGDLLDGEGPISCKLITRVKSADAFASAEDARSIRRVRDFALAFSVVFDETLELHLSITDTFKSAATFSRNY